MQIQEQGKNELILSPLEKMEVPQSLMALRKAVGDRLPRVDLPEILLEIAARAKFSESFTHITERMTRADGLTTSLCAVLLAEACNTGIEPLVCDDNHQLKRDRLSWVDQNYIRDETLMNANNQWLQSKIISHLPNSGEEEKLPRQMVCGSLFP